ncbi:MAG: hypothetical protein Q8R04_00775 [Nanoarchaeota archaeon]|nr:hypothetical protein [Nanoarchaeota archaeon]
MRVDIEKRHIGSYERIAREANKAVRSSVKVNIKKFQKALLQQNISAEDKKKRLAKILHELVISTFSLDASKIRGKKTIENIKLNISLIRDIIQKIKAINNYIEEGLLKELGIIKRPWVMKALKSENPVAYLEKGRKELSKTDIGKIEHTVYELMQRIIFFDRKLLKGYKKKEVNAIQSEKLGIKDIEKILFSESELLDVLEAKIPPARKFKARLLKKSIFNSWAPMVFALLSSFETEHSKETEIFSKIKGNNRLRKKIESKIRHIADEKEKMLKIQEKRALAMESFEKISDGHRQAFHDYVSAANM